MDINKRLQEEGLGDRKVAQVKEFKSDGSDFSAISLAEKYVRKLGYNKGSMCRDMPIALSKNANYIAKWRNIDPEEYSKIEAVLLSNGMREDEVFFVRFKK